MGRNDKSKRGLRMLIKSIETAKCEFGHKKKYSLCPSCEKVDTTFNGYIEPGDVIKVTCSASGTPDIEMKVYGKPLYGEDKWEEISGITSVKFKEDLSKEEIDEFINAIEPGQLSTASPGLNLKQSIDTIKNNFYWKDGKEPAPPKPPSTEPEITMGKG